MSLVRFIADLHLGHENMAIKRGFANAYLHDEHILNKRLHQPGNIHLMQNLNLC